MEKYIYQTIKNCNWKYNNETKQRIDEEIKEINKNIIYRGAYLNQHKNECFDKKMTIRKEEWICKLSFKYHQYLNSELGKIIDYQVPLKLPKKNIPLKMQKYYKSINEGRGKIDLISKNDKTKTVYLIEVKVSKNTENPCKAVLEIYTYYNLLGGDKGINEFLNIIDCVGYKCKTAILFEKNKDIKKESSYEGRFNKNIGKVRDLAKDYGVECYNFEIVDSKFIKKINKYHE